LTEPGDVAWFLAWYARDARERIERIHLPALADQDVEELVPCEQAGVKVNDGGAAVKRT
jgi:hypothetical protein